MNNTLVTTVGLTKKEAEVYETTLKCGECPIMEIVKKMHVHPQIVYRAADSLQQRGLVQFVIRGSKRYMRAEDPRMLETFEEKRLKDVQKAIPSLLALSQVKEREGALIKVSGGKEAVRSIRAQAIVELAQTKTPSCRELSDLL